jgi:hypothetical protein
MKVNLKFKHLIRRFTHSVSFQAWKSIAIASLIGALCAEAYAASAPPPPQILPPGRLFVGSVDISFAASSPFPADAVGAVGVVYTLDGSDPSAEPGNPASIAVNISSAANHLIFDREGLYVLKAMMVWMSGGASPSDIVMKRFEVVNWLSEPDFQLPAAQGQDSAFLAPFNMTARCPSSARPDLRVCFTSRPRSSSSSYPDPAAAAVPECLGCRDPFRIDEAGTYDVAAYYSIDGIRISNISRREIILRRPLFDVKKVLVQRNRPFQYKPVVDVFVVSKDLTSPASPSYCAPSKRVVPGHHVVLHNPLGHVDFLQPAARCGRGLSLPSDTGRNFSIQSARLAYSKSASYVSMLSRMSPGDIKLWRSQHESSHDSGTNGCSVVANGGFFDIENFDCFGNLVSGGRVVQVSTRHNVNFGIRDGNFHIGYIDLGSAAAGSESPFDTLISGLGWLVRNGRSYVSESLRSAAAGGDGEDMSAQSNGPAFASILSARTAIGYDAEGRLMLLQVEGESFVRGMSLYEFADFLVELGFESAINLDGGGSATVTARNELVTEPSWKCSSAAVLSALAAHDDDVVPRDLLPPGAEYRVCEKPVSSIMCIHALPPPSLQELEHFGLSSAAGPSAAPSRSPPSSALPTSAPSSATPSSSPSDNHPPLSPPKIDDNCEASTKVCTDENLSMRSSLLIYRTSTFFLAIILVLSLTVNGWWMITFRAEREAATRSQRASRPPDSWSDHRMSSAGVELHRPPAARMGAGPQSEGRLRGDLEVGGDKHLDGVGGAGSSSSEEEESDEDDETSSLTKSPVRTSERSTTNLPPLSSSALGKRMAGSINPFSKRKF